MAILTSADYPAVRAAIEATLSVEQAPDAVIAMPIYVGAAEDEIARRAPDAITNPDPTVQATLKRAAIRLTAALLCPAIPSLTSERYGDQSYGRKATDYLALAQSLRGQVDSDLALLDPVATAPTRPTMFTVATGRRGR
jgi:hypothetical protein